MIEAELHEEVETAVIPNTLMRKDETSDNTLVERVPQRNL